MSGIVFCSDDHIRKRMKYIVEYLEDDDFIVELNPTSSVEPLLPNLGGRYQLFRTFQSLSGVDLTNKTILVNGKNLDPSAEPFLKLFAGASKIIFVTNVSLELRKRIARIFMKMRFCLSDIKYNCPLGSSYIALYRKATPEIIGTDQFKLCTGCGACVSVCPAKALRLGFDAQGRIKPIIDLTSCVSCNQCIKTCPSLNYDYQSSHNYLKREVAYGLKARPDILSDSSSGGAFSAFAEVVLEKGGAIYGAAWEKGDEFEYMAKIVRIVDKESLGRLRHSKYIQSDVGTSYRQVRDDLIDGRVVLYTALPCQIAGLNAFLSTQSVDTTRLYTIDLLCAGSPNPVYLNMYMSENYPGGSITFRTVPGVAMKHQICFDGKTIVRDKKDFYEKAYHSKSIFGMMCKECPYAYFPRCGDITIGDFWSSEKVFPDTNCVNHSLVFLNTEQGKLLFEQLSPDIRLRPLADGDYRKTGNRINRDGSLIVENLLSIDALIKEHGFNNTIERVCFGKHDVGLMSVNLLNYGSHLTCYALYKWLIDNGLSVLIIVPPEEKFAGKKITFNLFNENPFLLCDLSEYCKDVRELRKFNNNCSFFILGSDQQLQMANIEKYDFATYMNWVNSDKYLAGYSVSFGDESKLPDDSTLVGASSFLLSRFDKLSVRESDAVKTFKNKYGVVADWVLDPVFLLKKEDYLNLYSTVDYGLRIDVPFVFYYVLDESSNRADIINSVGGRIGVESIVIYNFMKESKLLNDDIHFLKNASVEEWLHCVDSADYFITDSFHGLCFALIFKKQFVVMYESFQKRGSSRIFSFLNELGMMDRLLVNPTADTVIEKLSQPIDYLVVDGIIERKLLESKQWLSDCIECAKSSTKSSTVYDYIRWELDQL